MDCAMCKNAGTVWAPSRAFPRGFKIFCGGSLTRHEDGVHVEIVCPSCDGQSAARDQSQGGESKEKAPAETEAPSPICGND